MTCWIFFDHGAPVPTEQGRNVKESNILEYLCGSEYDLD